ncbi:MAG: LytTR family DNA-binding domain-containing protein [Chitinophagaceae bacterium]
MIRCIIVDDKPLAIDILKDYTSKISFLQLVYTTQNPLDALDYVRNNPVDLIFLDIQMPEISGIQFLKILNGAAKVILTTAYTEYALEGYEHDVIDYLLKPVSFDRFYKAVEKARKLLETAPAVAAPASVAADTSAAESKADTNGLFIKTEYKIQRIDFSAIRYIEARQNYIVIVTTGEPLMSLQSIKSIEEKLPPAMFMRVHKSYIISLQKIDTIERSRIFIGEAVIPVGDSYRDAFFNRLNT